MTKLGGAHVVITGGSSGIGLATAREVVARGGLVSLLARDQARLADAAAAVGAVATASVDVADANALRAAIDDVVATAGPATSSSSTTRCSATRWRSTTSARCTRSAPSCRR
jgi:3-dehydrosphinganine reductase